MLVKSEGFDGQVPIGLEVGLASVSKGAQYRYSNHGKGGLTFFKTNTIGAMPKQYLALVVPFGIQKSNASKQYGFAKLNTFFLGNFDGHGAIQHHNCRFRLSPA